MVQVGYTLPDGSVRLAREMPQGSESWQARYGRRNLFLLDNPSLDGHLPHILGDFSAYPQPRVLSRLDLLHKPRNRRI